MTTIPNYRKRSGVTTLFKTVKYLCKLFGLYHDSILNWLSGHVFDPGQYETVRAWLEGIQTVCTILDNTPDD
jgi:hypothetical protein